MNQCKEGGTVYYYINGIPPVSTLPGQEWFWCCNKLTSVDIMSHSAGRNWRWIFPPWATNTWSSRSCSLGSPHWMHYAHQWGGNPFLPHLLGFTTWFSLCASHLQYWPAIYHRVALFNILIPHPALSPSIKLLQIRSVTLFCILTAKFPEFCQLPIIGLSLWISLLPRMGRCLLSIWQTVPSLCVFSCCNLCGF